MKQTIKYQFDLNGKRNQEYGVDTLTVIAYQLNS